MEKEISRSISNKLQEAISAANEVLFIFTDVYMRQEENEETFVRLEKQILYSYRNNIFEVADSYSVTTKRRLVFSVLHSLSDDDQEELKNQYLSLSSLNEISNVRGYVKPKLKNMLSKAVSDLSEKTGFTFSYSNIEIDLKTTINDPSGYPNKGIFLDTFHSTFSAIIDIR